MDFLQLVFLTALYIGGVIMGVQKMVNFDVLSPYLTCFELKKIVLKYQKQTFSIMGLNLHMTESR